MAERREDGCRELDDPGDREQQAKTHDEGKADADLAGFVPALGWQLVRKDRNEDQVVDAKHDFHNHKRHKRDPRGWVLNQCCDVHRKILLTIKARIVPDRFKGLHAKDKGGPGGYVVL